MQVTEVPSRRRWKALLFATLGLASSLLAVALTRSVAPGFLAENWIITPVAFLAATVANATAVGGGFLFVPLFIFGYGLTPAAAVKLSLATQAFGMSSGAVAWSSRYISMRALLIAGPASCLGMYIGTLEWTLSSQLVKKAFGFVSLFIFAAIVLETAIGRLEPPARHRTRPTTEALFALACVGGGLITAWTAIGIGEVVALYLLFVHRLRIETAIGTGVAVLAVDSVFGLALHAHLGGIEWKYLAFTAPGVILGGAFGAWLGRRIEGQHDGDPSRSPLKWTFAAVILIDGIGMLIHSYLAG